MRIKAIETVHYGELMHYNTVKSLKRDGRCRSPPLDEAACCIAVVPSALARESTAGYTPPSGLSYFYASFVRSFVCYQICEHILKTNATWHKWCTGQ